MFYPNILSDEEDINPFVARKLLKFATDYGLAKLSEICEKQLEDGIRPETVLHVLELGKMNYAREYVFFSCLCLTFLCSQQIQILDTLENCYNFICFNFPIIDFSTTENSGLLVDVLTSIQIATTHKFWKKHTGRIVRKKSSRSVNDPRVIGLNQRKTQTVEVKEGTKEASTKEDETPLAETPKETPNETPKEASKETPKETPKEVPKLEHKSSRGEMTTSDKGRRRSSSKKNECMFFHERCQLTS